MVRPSQNFEKFCQNPDLGLEQQIDNPHAIVYL